MRLILFHFLANILSKRMNTSFRILAMSTLVNQMRIFGLKRAASLERKKSIFKM